MCIQTVNKCVTSLLVVVAFFGASSAESVGSFWFRKIPKLVI
jgi:hypothetical protein